jgi:hypothetical protein
VSATDYEKIPRNKGPKSDFERNPKVEGEGPEDEQKILQDWVDFVEEAEEHRKQFLPQVKMNRKFAAGKQHLNISTRDGRVVDVKERNGIKMVTADILTPYVQTVIGRMGGNDIRPNFIASVEGEQALQASEHMNLAFGWGWDNEWRGDDILLKVWRHLVIDGTCALRCKFDKNFGNVIGDVPYKNGKMIYDKDEQVKVRAETFSKGEKLETRKAREGKIVWELLTIEQLLPPPGFDDPDDFPREAVVRPMLIKDLKSKYGDKAEKIEEDEIEDTAALTAGLGHGDQSGAKLKGRALVYTGYRRPCAGYPDGQVVIFTKDVLLENRKHLPYSDEVRGPTTGLHYFRWQIIPGRFQGRAFIEGGLGPQMIRNKRLTQIDAIIDRGMPFVLIEEQSLARRKSGAPMEYVEIRPGAPIPKVENGVPPGAWMLQDVKLQEENAERAMGLSSVTMGQPPQGVSAYSAMALLTENNNIKLDAVAQDVSGTVKKLSWDTMEAMRNWLPNKKMDISGPENQVQSLLFNSKLIPGRFLVKMPRVGSMPRSQAAELQKINDIWAASAGKLPLEWYVNSLNAGKAQDLPVSLGDQQLHKAEMENILMQELKQPIPVSDSDDHMKHVESHRTAQIPWKTLADMGDPNASQVYSILEAHIQEHSQTAENVAIRNSEGMMQPQNPQMPTAGPNLPPQNMPDPNGMPQVPQAPQLPTLPGA